MHTRMCITIYRPLVCARWLLYTYYKGKRDPQNTCTQTLGVCALAAVVLQSAIGEHKKSILVGRVDSSALSHHTRVCWQRLQGLCVCVCVYFLCACI